jgi:hypothetical protein
LPEKDEHRRYFFPHRQLVRAMDCQTVSGLFLGEALGTGIQDFQNFRAA